MTALDPKLRPEYRIEALSKGLRFLSCFSEDRPALRLNEIASGTGLLMPTAYRIAMTLVAEGYLELLADGRYQPSLKVLELGYSALQSRTLVSSSSSVLHNLARETDETVNLGVLAEDQVMYLIRIRNTDLVTANIQVGSQLPAVHTSMGKMLLASLPDDEVRARLTLRSFHKGAGPNAVPDVEALSEQLAEIRSNGYALQDEEVAYGLRSIAVPILDKKGVVAAINIAVRSHEWTIDRVIADLLEPLRAAAAEISEVLGVRRR